MGRGRGNNQTPPCRLGAWLLVVGAGQVTGWQCQAADIFLLVSFLLSKPSPGRSQDGGLGRGIRVSSQLGHLPGTGAGPWTPKGTGGTPSDWVGRGAWGE